MQLLSPLKMKALELNPKNAFKGWNELSKIAKTGKVLGWTGKIANIYMNGKKDLFDDKTSSIDQKIKNFAIGSGVDALSGAAIGTLVGGPVGTVVGAGAGLAFDFALNFKVKELGNESITGFAKKGLKNLAGGLGF